MGVISIEGLSDLAKWAREQFHVAVAETKAWLQAKALGAFAGLSGVTFGGDHAAGEHVATNNVGSPIRGGPGTGRA